MKVRPSLENKKVFHAEAAKCTEKSSAFMSFPRLLQAGGLHNTSIKIGFP